MEILKIIGLLLLSATKFFLAPTSTVLAGFNFWQTIAITVIGGFIGLIVFFRFGLMLQKFIRYIFNIKPKNKFSKRNRLLVKIKSKHGLIGLAVLTPCLLGIPIGALIASIYYKKQRQTLLIFGLFIVIWSFILTTITIYFKNQ